MTRNHASISDTATIMECCVCYDSVKPEEAYKFWECNYHYTCRRCGVSLNNCPLCRKPCGSYTPRPCAHSKEEKIREDWREEAIKRGLWDTRPLSMDEDHNDNKCIIQAWTAEGRALLSKRWAIKLNVQDIRLSW